MTEPSSTFVAEMNEIRRPLCACAAKGEGPVLISAARLYIIDGETALKRTWLIFCNFTPFLEFSLTPCCIIYSTWPFSSPIVTRYFHLYITTRRASLLCIRIITWSLPYQYNHGALGTPPLVTWVTEVPGGGVGGGAGVGNGEGGVGVSSKGGGARGPGTLSATLPQRPVWRRKMLSNRAKSAAASLLAGT